MRIDWMEEWYDYMSAEEALDDLKDKPKLKLIQGGKDSDGSGISE